VICQATYLVNLELVLRPWSGQANPTPGVGMSLEKNVVEASRSLGTKDRGIATVIGGESTRTPHGPH
jgi:hypothetical protein